MAELRRRKDRDDKPFAVLVADLDAAAELGVLDAAAAAALASTRRPDRARAPAAGAPVAEPVAPGLPELGLLLPYSPLHHLLARGVGRPLVLTSGNLSDEPIAHDDGDAVERLGPLVDGILGHDRPIHIRCDDSVARATRGRLQLLRRSRGYAPEPMRAAGRGADATCSPSVPSSRARSPSPRAAMVVASHHIGDLEHLATYRSFLQAVDHLGDLYGVEPEVVACDLHPEYLSSKFAADLDLPVVAVQHHHAHVAACMVEHGRIDAGRGARLRRARLRRPTARCGAARCSSPTCARVRAGRPTSAPRRCRAGSPAIREPWRMAAVWARRRRRAARPDVLAAVLDWRPRAATPR